MGALHREALALARQAEGPEGPTVARSLILLGRLARDQGDYQRAESLYRRGLAVERRPPARGDAKALRDRGELAAILLDGGKPQEAEALLVDNLRRMRRMLGADRTRPGGRPHQPRHGAPRPGTLRGRGGHLPRGASALQKPAGDTDPARGILLGNLAATLQAQGRAEESVPLLAETLELRRRILGERHPLVAQVLLHLARAERLSGRPARGLDLARRALRLVEEAEGPEHPHVAYPLREIGALLLARGEAAAAEPVLRRALDVRRRGLSGGHPDVAQAEIGLAGCLAELGRRAEAAALLRRGRAALAAQFGAGDERVRQADERLAALAAGRPPER